MLISVYRVVSAPQYSLIIITILFPTTVKPLVQANNSSLLLQQHSPFPEPFLNCLDSKLGLMVKLLVERKELKNHVNLRENQVGQRNRADSWISSFCNAESSKQLKNKHQLYWKYCWENTGTNIQLLLNRCCSDKLSDTKKCAATGTGIIKQGHKGWWLGPILLS